MRIYDIIAKERDWEEIMETHKADLKTWKRANGSGIRGLGLELAAYNVTGLGWRWA